MGGVRGVGAKSITYTQTQGENKIKAKLKAAPSEGEHSGEESGIPTKDAVALTQALSAYAGHMKPGEKIKIKVGKDEIASIEKEGPTAWDKFTRGVRDMGAMMMDVSKEAIETDPSFVFRETVEMAKEPLTQAAPETIKELSLKGLYPGVRAGVLFLDIRKAWKTLKDPKSTLADKVIDVGHCITDVGGLIGAAAPILGVAIPGAATLAAVAIVGDIISFGYHTLMYVLHNSDGEAEPLHNGDNKPQNPQNETQPTQPETTPDKPKKSKNSS